MNELKRLARSFTPFCVLVHSQPEYNNTHHIPIQNFKQQRATMCVYGVCTMCVCVQQNMVWSPYNHKTAFKSLLALLLQVTLYLFLWMCVRKGSLIVHQNRAVRPNNICTESNIPTRVCIWEERARWTKKLYLRMTPVCLPLPLPLPLSTNILFSYIFILSYWLCSVYICIHTWKELLLRCHGYRHRGTWHTSDTESLNRTTSYRTVVTSRHIHCINVQFSYRTDINMSWGQILFIFNNKKKHMRDSMWHSTLYTEWFVNDLLNYLLLKRLKDACLPHIRCDVRYEYTLLLLMSCYIR